MILEIVAGIIAVVLIFTLGFFFLKTRYDFNKIVKLYVKETMQRKVLEKELASLKAEYDALKLNGNNDFVKFLSDSRDSAFQYIENVQTMLFDLKKAVDNKERKEVNSKVKQLLSMLPENNIPNN